MQIDPATRKRALEPLGALIGEWSMQASFPPSSPIAGEAPVGRVVFEWILDGQFLLGHAEIPHPDVPDSTTIVGYDPERDAYTQHYFDSRGVARVYAMTFSGGVWSLLRQTPDFTPLDFTQRFTARLSDDGSKLAGSWESGDGARWEHDFDLTYTRLR